MRIVNCRIQCEYVLKDFIVAGFSPLPLAYVLNYTRTVDYFIKFAQYEVFINRWMVFLKTETEGIMVDVLPRYFGWVNLDLVAGADSIDVCDGAFTILRVP